MKRKLIKQGGGGGLTLYIPKKWADARGLKGGDEIEITEVDNSLLVSTEVRLKKKEIELKFTTEEKAFIIINLNNIYRLGYDKIKVSFKTNKQANIVKEAVENNLLGFEITESGKDFLVLESVTEPSEEKQEVLLRRMFLLIKESLDLFSKDFQVGKFQNLSTIHHLTQKVVQYDNFCRRNISRKKFTEEKVNFYWSVYSHLLLIQRSLLHLYEQLSQKQFRISKNAMSIFNSVSSSLNALYEAVYKKDVELLRQANEGSQNALNKQILPALLKSSGLESVVLHYLGEFARLTYVATSPALSILLQ